MKFRLNNGILDFFFPIQKRLRMEAATYYSFDGKRLKLKREFGTFRAFYSHYLDVAFTIPFRETMKEIQLNPRLGALAFDATSTSSNDTGTSLTFSHTCTGTELGLVVGNSTNWVGDSSDTATYNAVSMTKEKEQLDGPNTNKAEIFSLQDPATGANDVVISTTGSRAHIGGAISFSGVKQGGFIGNIAGATDGGGSSSTVSVGITSTSASNFIVDTFCVSGNTSRTVGTGQTERWNTYSGATNNIGGGGSTEQGTGTVTMSWTLGSATTWVTAAVEVLGPISGPANVKTYNGLAKASVKTVDGLAIGSVKTWNGLT